MPVPSNWRDLYPPGWRSPGWHPKRTDDEWLDVILAATVYVDECWIDTKPNKDGYSRYYRKMYELFVGVRTKGMTLDHTCRVPACHNPDHLEEVTYAENNLRAGSLRHPTGRFRPIRG